MTNGKRAQVPESSLSGYLPGTAQVLELVNRIAGIPDVAWSWDLQTGVRGAVGRHERPSVVIDQTEAPNRGLGITEASWKSDGTTRCLCPMGALEWSREHSEAAAIGVHENPWDATAELHGDATPNWGTMAPEEAMKDITLLPWLLLVVVSDGTDVETWTKRTAAWTNRTKPGERTKRLEQAKRTASKLFESMISRFGAVPARKQVNRLGSAEGN